MQKFRKRRGPGDFLCERKGPGNRSRRVEPYDPSVTLYAYTDEDMLAMYEGAVKMMGIVATMERIVRQARREKERARGAELVDQFYLSAKPKGAGNSWRSWNKPDSKKAIDTD